MRIWASGLAVVIFAALFVVFTGEDRVLYGYSDRGGFWTERSTLAEAFAEGSVSKLMERGAEVACIDSVSVPSTAQRRWRERMAPRFDVPTHRAPNDDSSITVFVGYPDRTSQMIYLPKTAHYDSAAGTALGEPEGSGCFRR